MAISILRGKTYDLEDGLSSSSGVYFVVGKINAPHKIDSSLGWNNNDTDISFASSTFYIVTDATLTITPFATTAVQAGTDAKLLPSTYIEQSIIEESFEKIPVIIEGPAYSDLHDLTSSAKWYVSEIVERPIRIDKTLGWKDPGFDKPKFVTASCAVCFPTILNTATETLVPDTTKESSLVPLFLITKVLEWKRKEMIVRKLTSSEISALSSPASGTLIYNTTAETISFYTGSIWKNVTSTNL